MKFRKFPIETIIYDFDGVMTDNSVFIDRDGKEWLQCNKSDGLAVALFKKHNIRQYIVTSEGGPSLARARKLCIPCEVVTDKAQWVINLTSTDANWENLLYVGNDLNDLEAMEISRFAACPSDAHPTIILNSDIILTKEGGMGCVMELYNTLEKED